MKHQFTFCFKIGKPTADKYNCVRFDMYECVSEILTLWPSKQEHRVK